MTSGDFKLSGGNGESFDGLKVSVCSELCTMGVPSDACRHVDGAKYLSPEELHYAIQNMKQSPLPDKVTCVFVFILQLVNFYFKFLSSGHPCTT